MRHTSTTPGAEDPRGILTPDEAAQVLRWADGVEAEVPAALVDNEAARAEILAAVRRREELRPQDPPTIDRLVHYTAYGTPGGEYQSVCRAAMITGVGAWLTLGDNVERRPGIADGEMRTVHQRWHADACSLHVFNPTGDHYPVCRFEPGALANAEAVAGGAPILRSFAGGTWHWPGDGCNPGGTR